MINVRIGGRRAGRVMMAAVVAMTALMATSQLAGCTESRLKKEAAESEPTYDNQMRVKGRYCTAPSADVSFPVKVLFLLDQSASLQCTDSTNKRFPALRSSVDSLLSRPNTEVSFIGFSSGVNTLGFTRNRGDIDEFIDPAAAGNGSATDYQGALATAISTVEADMLDVGPAERARTRYQIVFVGDGVPKPSCLAGCEDGATACTDDEDNDGDGLVDANDPDCDNVDDVATHPDTNAPVCNIDPEDIRDDDYVDMTGRCPAYNQPPQIRRRIEELLGLADTYSAGGVSLNTVLLFSPQAVVEAQCQNASQDFGFDRDKAQALLQEMADQGNGSFRDINTDDTDDEFLQFDITSLKAEQTLTSMLATNVYARRHDQSLAVDTDHDGLADADEAALGTDPLKDDTDGDHYHDLFEQRFRAEGFGPADAQRPALSCDDDDDRDNDGLNGCEESFLATSTLLADTDGDDLIDWYEVRDGTDPLVADADGDLDFDGVSNADEIRAGTAPDQADQQVYRDQRIVYSLDDRHIVDTPRQNGDDTDERHCYDFDISRLPLVVTPVPRQNGLNRIMVYATEKPTRVGGVTGETHVACFEAFYDGAQVKHPESGVIDVSQTAIDDTRQQLTEAFDGLNRCAYFGGPGIGDDAGNPGGTQDAGASASADPLDRDRLEEMIETCMAPKIALQQHLYKQSKLLDIVESNLDSDLTPKLPGRSWRLFKPIQNFDADRDCYRPWEFDLIERFVAKMKSACATCPAP